MFAERIVKLRKAKKMTQEQLADTLGISRAALSHYENGRREPDFQSVVKFAEFFGVSADYLLGRTDDPTKTPPKDDIGPEPHRNPLGVQLTPEQVELLREMRDDPEVLGMFRDFANSTEDERRMMLEIWEAVRRRKTGGRRSD